METQTLLLKDLIAESNALMSEFSIKPMRYTAKMRAADELSIAIEHYLDNTHRANFTLLTKCQEIRRNYKRETLATLKFWASALYEKSTP